MEALRSTNTIHRNEVARLVLERANPAATSLESYFVLHFRIKEDAISPFKRDKQTQTTLKSIAEAHRVELNYGQGEYKSGAIIRKILEIRLRDGAIGGETHRMVRSPDNLISAGKKVVALLGELIDYEDVRKQLLRRE